MTAAAPPRVIPPAALALVAEACGRRVEICVTCTRALTRSGRCQHCAGSSVAAVIAAPPPNAAVPPRRPCRHCHLLCDQLTYRLCSRCYFLHSRLEDYRYLISSRMAPEVAAARVGVSLRTIERHKAEWKDRPAKVAAGELVA